MEYQKERGRIRANSTSSNGKRPNLVNFKVSYDLKQRGLVLKSWRQNLSLSFWILKGSYFVLLCLGCSCRGGISILNSTKRYASHWQVRNFTSVTDSIFEVMEGNFKTKKVYKIIQNWVLVGGGKKTKTKKNLESVGSIVEWRLSSKKTCSFPQLSKWEFCPWLQYIPLPNDLSRTVTVWVVF